MTNSWKQLAPRKDTVKHGKMAYCAEVCGANSPLDKLYVK